MFVYFIICITKHNTPKIYKTYHQKYRFFNIMGLQNVIEHEFHRFGNLVIWFWKCDGNFLKGVFTNRKIYSLGEKSILTDLLL